MLSVNLDSALSMVNPGVNSLVAAIETRKGKAAPREVLVGKRGRRGGTSRLPLISLSLPYVIGGHRYFRRSASASAARWVHSLVKLLYGFGFGENPVSNPITNFVYLVRFSKGLIIVPGNRDKAFIVFQLHGYVYRTKMGSGVYRCCDSSFIHISIELNQFLPVGIVLEDVGDTWSPGPGFI